MIKIKKMELSLNKNTTKVYLKRFKVIAINPKHRMIKRIKSNQNKSRFRINKIKIHSRLKRLGSIY